MTIDETALRVASALRTQGTPYMIVGGFSSNLHGIPRVTRDVDVVVSAMAATLPDLSSILGAEWTRDPQITFETNTGTLRQVLECQSNGMRVELFQLSDDEHDQARFSRRVCRVLAGQEAYFPTAEDVIVWKLRWARPKDLDDVRNVILVQTREGALDWEYINTWCARHQTSERLQAILDSLPKP